MLQQKGFTLMELVLSIALIGVLAGLSIPLYQSFSSRNNLDIATDGVVAALRRAQTYAEGMHQDSQWGVKLQNGSAVLFKGSSYASRDTSYDETVSILANVTVSGSLTEVIFSKLTATPTTTGNAVLTATTNDIRTVTLNAKGTVSY